MSFHSDNIDRMAPCAIDGCANPSRTIKPGGVCSMHLYRMRRTGTYNKRVIKPYVATHGYELMPVAPDHPMAQPTGRTQDRIRRWAYTHRVVLFDYLGPAPRPCHWCGLMVHWDRTYPKHRDGLVVDHLDGDKMNNTVTNLVAACNPCNTSRYNRDVRASA